MPQRIDRIHTTVRGGLPILRDRGLAGESYSRCSTLTRQRTLPFHT